MKNLLPLIFFVVTYSSFFIKNISMAEWPRSKFISPYFSDTLLLIYNL